MRVPANRAFPIRLVHEDADGHATEATGTVDVTVTDPDGTTVDTGTATEQDDNGVYEYTLPKQSTLDRYHVEFDFGDYTETLGVDVVGHRLVSLHRLREEESLASVSGTIVRRLAAAVEEWFASALGFPPVPEGRRIKWYQYERSVDLRLPGVQELREVYSLKIEDTTYDSDDYSILEPDVLRIAGATADPLILGLDKSARWPLGEATAHVSMGMEYPPENLKRAAMILARYVARTTNFPERAARIVDNESEIIFSMPSPDRPTGLPEVDGVLSAYWNDLVV